MYGWNPETWRKTEKRVFKLQKRIYQASRRGDAGRVREAVAGALANMLLFVPLGAVVAFRGWSLARVAAVAFFVSASVEVAQLFVPGRTTSLDDVVFNVSGSVLGYALVAARARETPTVPAAGGRERRASETPCTNPRR